MLFLARAVWARELQPSSNWEGARCKPPSKLPLVPPRKLLQVARLRLLEARDGALAEDEETAKQTAA
jgi:hypothetical protein